MPKLWTKCSCGHIKEDHDSEGTCHPFGHKWKTCSTCKGYDGKVLVDTDAPRIRRGGYHPNT